MKNVSNILKKSILFKSFVEKRGHEFLMATGCNIKLYKTSDTFEFEEDGVTVSFMENTGHDCPEYRSVYLSVEQLEKTDKEWINYIEYLKIETIKKEEKRRQDEQKSKLEKMRNEVEKLSSAINEIENLHKHKPHWND